MTVGTMAVKMAAMMVETRVESRVVQMAVGRVDPRDVNLVD